MSSELTQEQVEEYVAQDCEHLVCNEGDACSNSPCYVPMGYATALLAAWKRERWLAEKGANVFTTAEELLAAAKEATESE